MHNYPFFPFVEVASAPNDVEGATFTCDDVPLDDEEGATVACDDVPLDDEGATVASDDAPLDDEEGATVACDDAFLDDEEGAPPMTFLLMKKKKKPLSPRSGKK
jgi:hypothetical protein